MRSFATRRTTVADLTFRALTAELDRELHERYGAIQDAYDGFNVLPAETPAVIAFDGDDPLGCGCYRSFDATTIEIKRVFVPSRARRRGIAATIVGELERWASERDLTAAVLETGYLQHEAIAMYERLGYQRIDAFGAYVGMASSVCMRKAL